MSEQPSWWKRAINAVIRWATEDKRKGNTMDETQAPDPQGPLERPDSEPTPAPEPPDDEQVHGDVEFPDEPGEHEHGRHVQHDEPSEAPEQDDGTETPDDGS